MIETIHLVLRQNAVDTKSQYVKRILDKVESTFNGPSQGERVSQSGSDHISFVILDVWS